MANIVPQGIDQTTGQARPLSNTDTLVNSAGSEVAPLRRSTTLLYGGAVAASSYMRASALASTILTGSLDLDDQFVIPHAATTVTVSWFVTSTGGTMHIFRNSSNESWFFSTSTATGTHTQSVTWNAGDRIAVAYRSGTAQGNSLVVVQVTE